jgi:hypothetical protein
LYQFLGEIVVLFALKNKNESQSTRSKTDAVRDVHLYPGLWPSRPVLVC